MSIYNKILVVVDLSADSALLMARAQLVAPDATLTLLHVVEYIPLEPMGETIMPALQMEAELLKRAKEKLAELATEHGLTHCEQLVTLGSTKAEIQQTAQQIGAQLVVVGNHERRGLSALLNFTEDAVLHTAPCDVLAVHLPRR